MKLISLNIWWGKQIDPLMDFIREQKDSTDIFCFQEIFSSSDKTEYSVDYQPNIFEILCEELDDFNAFFVDDVHGLNPHVVPVDFDLRYGNAIFVRKALKINQQSSAFIYRESSSSQIKQDCSDEPRVILTSEIDDGGRIISIANYHGMCAPGNKLDSPDRLEQSRRILKVLEGCRGEIVLAGDFNLMPETESVKMIERSGLINLIKKFNIQETRGNLNPYAGTPEAQHFADYIFVSSGINVKSFEVPDVRVSDHCPMILEFSVD